ncbi:MAG: tetratricopeptide repeat protein [candidate division Zixibacteria bacterium]|nr:tetratricopeptide repeat protein [candidate division Zixibacteria bacterium]
MKLRNLIKLGLIAILLVSLSCAYYNTFYYAKKNFKKAESSQKKANRQIASSEEKRLYDAAIQKASKVLTFHSKSRWVDDALLVIGMSFYYEGEYSKAERKFSELTSSFPRSELVLKARFYQAMCQYRLEEYDGAISSLKSILADPKSKNLREQIYFTLGEIYFQQKRYDEAIESYQTMMQKYKKSELLAQAQYRIGESYLQKKDYLGAQEALSQVNNFKPANELIFNSAFKTAECYYVMDKISSGIELLNKLAKDERFYQKLPAIKLKIAEGFYLLDKDEEAIEEYQEITTSYPKTEESAMAYYQLGIIYQERTGDLKKAKEMFDKSKDEKPGSTCAKKALEKSASLAKVDEYKKQLSIEEAKETAKTTFLLAELYLTQINQPDSAIAEYLSLVEHHPQSEYAPKSLYAAAWVLQNIKVDSVAASNLYQRLIKEYPHSDYVKPAYRFLKQSPSSKETYAEEEYLKAEELLLAKGKVDSALALYRKIVRDYPQSEYAPKASYAIAWTIENLVCPNDSSSILAYQEVVDKFPQTEYATRAKSKLSSSGMPKSTPIASLPQNAAPITRSDTTKSFPDTTQYSIPLAPTPIIRGPFVYPESERDSGIQGKVVLKIKIDYPTGTVAEADVLGSLNNYNIDEAAKKAAMSTFFSPDSFAVKPPGGYYLYTVDVIKYGTGQYDSHLDQTNF